MTWQAAATVGRRGVILICFLGLIWGGAESVWAGTMTTPGIVDLAPADKSLVVEAPYGGDDTSPNNTLKIEWSEDNWNTTSSIDIVHQANPYRHRIAGLTNGVTCQVRVTFLDSDGFDGPGAIQALSAIPHNPLLHSSLATNSTKWSGSWGVTGGKYGEFTCGTCHARNATNIKRIRSSLTAPGGVESFPVQAGGGTISFTDASDNATGTGFGDDSGGHATSSRICEGCHSQNKYHNYNTANNTGHLLHNNDRDCMACHRHGEGFRSSSCSGCHGGQISGAVEKNFWPASADRTSDSSLSANDSGAHEVHMAILADRVHGLTVTQLLDDEASGAKQITLCGYCHDNAGADADHANGDDAEVAGFRRIWDGGVDSGLPAVFEYDFMAPATATCSNVDCHNGKATGTENGWYAGSTGDCLLCHSDDRLVPNTQAFADPASGLHLADPAKPSITGHDSSFGAGGDCTSCHELPPGANHLDGLLETDTSGFNFSPAIDLKIGDPADANDDTCASSCHSDGGNWYRRWSTDAFDTTAVDLSQPLPPQCLVCHGVLGQWAEGTSHAGTFGGTASTIGSSHNSQIGNPGAACEDCHVHPSRADLHQDNQITLNDSATGEVDPIRTTVGSDDYIQCNACHTPDILPPATGSKVFPESTAFSFSEVEGATSPQGGCFSGATGCHGDALQNWWPAADPYADGQGFDPADPSIRTVGSTNYGYPNRVGAHPEHNITIGKLIAETRTGNPDAVPTQDDFNNTCQFCHPMGKNASGVLEAIYHHDGKTDLYGGFLFPSADARGIVAGGNPAGDPWTLYDLDPADGYIYQLDNPDLPGSVYPLDGDGSYRQFLYDYRADSGVNHGTCSIVACHSNAPFTPQWYGDDQPPGQILDLAAATHDTRQTHTIGVTDRPGTVLLTWTSPGDNGRLNGTAYEYEVYYSSAGTISAANLDSATRAGGIPSVLREGTAQEMAVDGLDPGTSYWFAVRTKDEPFFEDTDGDGIHETFVRDGNLSTLTATVAGIAAHVDDVPPIYWGITGAASHDTGDAVNLFWDAARDHTLPITYRVYWSDYSFKTHLARGGVLPAPGTTAYAGGVEANGYSEDTGGGPPTPGGSDYTIFVSTSHALTYQATGLSPGVLYNFLVRAEDGVTDPVPNVDPNRVVAVAMASSLPQEPERTELYLLSGANAMTLQADPTSPDWGGVTASSVSLAGTGSVTFTAGSDLDGATSRDTWLQAISIDLHVANTDRRLPQSFSVQIGYDNGTFTPIGAVVDVGLGRRASRVMKIGLAANSGLVPANANLAIRFARTTTSGSISNIDLAWGDATNKGQLLVNAQPVNHAPSPPVVGSLSRDPGGYIQVAWSPSNDGGDGGQSLHYDVSASCDGGITWPYVLGHDLNDADAVTGVRWDTVGDGLDRFSGGQYNCQVKVDASDGYLYETPPGSHVWLSHTASNPAAIGLDNRFDDEAPAAPTIHHIETRPKQGTAYLEWIAVGNDGYNHGTRAAYYDIRFRKGVDGDLNDARWNEAATVHAEGEPVPGFSGHGESFELLDMTPDTAHTVAMKTCDAGEDDAAHTADDNCSPLSNVVGHMSGQYYCGICHSTPPDEPDTRGTHREHGFTEEDCAKCHGDAVLTYDGRHYDGVINIGWGENSDGSRAPLAGLQNASGGSGVTLTQTIDGGDITIYQDPDGAGGYNSGTAYDPVQPLKNTDSGSCLNFGAANVAGCHGPFEPKWESDTTGVKVEPTCADCHGSKSMTAYDDIDNEVGRLTDPYGRNWDDSDAGDTVTVAAGTFNRPSEEVEASPPIDNHNLGGKDTRYTGAHLRHLNASYRFAQGDSCRLCHRDTMESGLHANRQVDVVFESAANQSETVAAVVDATLADVDTLGVSCSSLNNIFCHDTGARWAEPGAKCNDCHGMAGKAYDPVGNTSGIGHVMGAMGDVVPCEYCHLPGHPQSPDGVNPGDSDALLINNNPAVGINYRSGGIHLKRVYPWGTYNTLAEICWGCHDQNHDGDLNDAGDINEFATNQRSATGNSPYDYGSLDQARWIGAVWSSGQGRTSADPFYYKRGFIQSTHSTDPTGTSKVVWNPVRGRYDETLDTVDKIRCSNCHDVHDLNRAPGDTMSGIPYLRGTWMGNPYEEDGAPYNGQTYTEPTDGAIDYTFGAVPRGGTEYDQLGGYYVDQNNAVPGTGANANPTPARYPTSGWTLKSSAGLCTLCHHTDVDGMDQRTPAMDSVEGNLWLGGNGHSNSALGGTFSAATNIFDYRHGRPTPVFYDWGGGRPRDKNHFPVLVPDMAFLDQGENSLAGGGYRGQDSNSGMYNPKVTVDEPYAFNGYDWGATVDADTTDQMYHQFSCSKCHNPHASRLPKLMITNCLDTRHNTWDDNQTAPFLQNTFTASALTAADRGMPAAYYASAQNCHRFDGRRADSTLRGGWNKVTPWAYTNNGTATEVEHKGADDPAYSSRTGN